MYKTVEQKLEDINQRLPETDFIAVFGTSHTSGYCKRNGLREINHNDFWVNNLHLPAVNFSLSGNTNINMLQQLCDFLKLSKAKNCKHILCETRVSEQTLLISLDFLKSIEEGTRIEFYPALNACYAHNNIIDHEYAQRRLPDITIHNNLQFRLPVSLLSKSKKYVKSYLSKMYPSNVKPEISDVVYNNIVKQLENFQNNFCTTMEGFINDYQLINIMETLCRSADIKFNWFCWDKHPLMNVDDPDYNIVRQAFDQSTHIFSSEIETLRNSVIENFKKENENITDYECDCGHWDATVHEFVAKQIVKAIK